MTPQEKAKQLFEKFRKASRHKYIERTGADADEQSKILALACVDEIIESDPFDPFNGDYYETIGDRLEYVAAYWHQVKEEINKL